MSRPRVDSANPKRGAGRRAGACQRGWHSVKRALDGRPWNTVDSGRRSAAPRGLTHPRPPAKTACVQRNDAGTTPPRHHSCPQVAIPIPATPPLFGFHHGNVVDIPCPPMAWPYAMDSTTHPHQRLIPNRPSFGEPLRRVPVQRPHLLPYTKCPSASGCSDCVHALSSPGQRFGRAETRRRCGRGGAGLGPAASTVMRLLSQIPCPPRSVGPRANHRRRLGGDRASCVSG